MSAQTMADAFAPVEAREKERVMAETWGHLAPKKNKTYKGHVVWALGCLGSDNLNPTILQFDFGDLTSSPWFFDALVEFLHTVSKEEGAMFRWDGTLRNYKFKGIVNRIYYEGAGDAPNTIKRHATRLTKQNFEAIATEIRKLNTYVARQKKAWELIPELRKSNTRFNVKRFLLACNA